MTLFCSPFLSIFAFFLLSISTASCRSPPPDLLSLNCSESSNGTLLHDQRIKTLFENLIVRIKNTHFVSFANAQFTGVMQCRVGQSQSECSLCAQYANNLISTLCPNSYAVTAWFDGCYIQYNHNHLMFSDQPITTRSCMNVTDVANPIQYDQPALETLFLRLRSEVNLVTHHGFSYGEINYGVNSKFYGLIECVRSLSPKECELCIGKVIDRLNESCGDKGVGIIAQRLCLVRFGSHKFYSESGGSGGGSAVVSVRESGKDGGGGGNSKRSLVWLLSGCSIFLLVNIFLALLVKRLALNRAQVAVENEKIESKVMVP